MVIVGNLGMCVGYENIEKLGSIHQLGDFF